MRRLIIFLIFSLFFQAITLSPVFAVTPKKSSAIQKNNEEEAAGKNVFGFKELVFNFNEKKEHIPSEKIFEWAKIEPSLKIQSEKKSEIENIFYCPVDKILCKLTTGLREIDYLKKETKISINEEKIKTYLEEFSQKFNTEAVNAKFQMGENSIVDFIPDQKGMKLDISQSIEKIKIEINENTEQETKEIDLPYQITEPEIKSGEVNSLGINALIGEGRSNFKGSPRNRIFNINVATEKFNGILIKPGEEFSFVKTLGPVDGEHGYAPELVIKHDKTEPEFGGGICQVSTTAFRAAINSGLKITMRRNHAYPVAYYNPQGMDATIYIPRPDLRFVNNTPNHILIQTKIEGTELIFKFYGTSDERKTEVIGPKIVERKPDGGMKTTFTQKVYDKNGNIFIDDVFNSNYDSPNKYPHPGEEKLTKKPKGWSDNEWDKYRKTNGI